MTKTIDMEETARKIKQAIEHSGYDIRQISEILGFSTPQAVYKWTQGKSLPKIDNLLILAHQEWWRIRRLFCGHCRICSLRR